MKMSQILNDSYVQIKLSLESGKNSSAPETSGKRQCENLLLHPSLLSSSPTPIWFKCSPPVHRLACNISLSSESAFCQHFMSKFTRVPSNRHEWTPRRFWFTIPDGTGAGAPALAFYPWLRGFYSFSSAALRVNLSNLTLGRSSEEPRFVELGGTWRIYIVQSYTYRS